MKRFRKRAATAAMLAVSMMLSIASPAFAEGSKELNIVPEGSNVNEHPAHRPYFEWRERMQFEEAGKNVIYVYAKAGETIFFGSNITNAQDRSIEAIVHPEKEVNTVINSTGKSWAGSSIAVTLPSNADENVAFDPEKKNWTNKDEIEELFRDGDLLVSEKSREKVYLFKPTPSGKGHILTPSQESKGPNGVNGTTDGYEPLSFVAPVTGTYSFRFLAKQYHESDLLRNDFTLATRPEPAGEIGQNTVLSPVPESYTWDFTKMASGVTYNTNTIVGYANNNDGDKDHNYYYDIMAHVTSGNQVKTGDKSIVLNPVKNQTLSSGLAILPAWAGKVEVTFSGKNTTVYIQQSNKYESNSIGNNTTTQTVTLDVVANQPVYIYNYSQNSNNVNIKSVSYTVTNPPSYEARKVDEQWADSIPSLVSAWDITVAKISNNAYSAQTGRVWTGRFVLNAGGFQKSIYPQFHVLTNEGFLYDVNLNGIQPWAFSFYSNNRGFLLDRWSLYSKPQLAYSRDDAQSTTDYLQSLEHSFFSSPTGSLGDIGPAPIRKEVDGNGVPVMNNNGEQMESTILGNYVPVDEKKDVTHKLFFNVPDEEALKAYTGESELKEIENANEEYSDLLNNIKYIGLGNSAEEKGNVSYGTIGIGGRFEVTITPQEAERLNALGSSSISILLDFSSYKLTGAVPIPVLKANGEWASSTSQTEHEKNNLVSLSAVIDNTAKDNMTYTLSWDGRDAYGNVVPEGEYNNVIKSYVEMGMAHFPILDVEHNPNGIKIQMHNEIDGNEDKKDFVYYNNEAVSPKVNPEDPSAWYYSGNFNNVPFPVKIGDGLNRTSGISSNFGDPSKNGAMEFGHYSVEDQKGDPSEGLGYGNSTALDIWSKYEISANAEITIGVAPIKPLKPYVSFVATKGRANIKDTPFDVSHVDYAGKRQEENLQNWGLDTIYGNTISTGFITNIATTAAGMDENYLTWKITIPASGEIDGDNKTYDSYIKIPTDDLTSGEAKLTTQAEADEAEYLAYELFSGMFEDYMSESGDEVNVGDEFVPDWDADASLSGDTDPGMVEAPDGAEYGELGVIEEMYFETAALEGVEAGDYKDNNWSVTVNVDQTAVMTDAEGVQTNKGNIYRINSFKSSNNESNYATITVKHKIPIVTGGSAIVVGIVIDNLYAPAATAKTNYSPSAFEGAEDITSALFGGTNRDSVQASIYQGYLTNPKNEYNLDAISIDDLEENLLMHITFDEEKNANGAFEATKGGNVTVTNTERSISYTDGKYGNAVNMTGKLNDYLELPRGIFNGLTSTSVSFWIKENSAGQIDKWAFMTTPKDKQEYLSEEYLGVLLGSDNITVQRYFSHEEARPAAASATGLDFDKWNLITINFESDTTSIYVNGLLSAEPTHSDVNLSDIFKDNARTWIGHANWVNGEGFAGMIDDFRIYNRALSQDEIMLLMNVEED